MGTLGSAKIRFRVASASTLPPGVKVKHTAQYGALCFLIVGSASVFKASVHLLDSTDQPFYYIAASVEAAKKWCRNTLCYILRGQVPFGDHEI